MTGRLVIVTGTGTEIGKTHLAEALLLALRSAGCRVLGLKPVESGVGEGPTDAARLAAASSFHVKHFGIALKAPVSPHRAAREEGVTVPIEALAAAIEATRAGADFVLVELPGGLFTPLGEGTLNADFAARLRPDFVLLAAPDRLGVLHEVVATSRAARALPLRLDGVVLIAPERADASTGTNAEDLGLYADVAVLATVPRGAPATLAGHPSIGVIAQALRR
jgi:dethiobiotin synthetase